jgi:hypothetical protein
MRTLWILGLWLAALAAAVGKYVPPRLEHPPDPWLAAGLSLPAITGEEAVVEAPADHRARFLMMLYGNEQVAGLLREEYRPADADVVYLRGRGWVSRWERAKPSVRIVAREVRRPIYPGARTLANGVFVTITHPDTGAFNAVHGQAALTALVAQFVSEPFVRTPAGKEYAQPKYFGNAILYPNGLTAYFDARHLYLVFHEDPYFDIPEVVTKLRDPKKRIDYKPAKDGSLSYPFTRLMDNPWIALAGREWPALKWKPRVVTPPAGEAARFADSLARRVQPTWVPATLAALPYDRHLGYVVVTETPQYRVRIRQVTMAVFGNAHPDRALVLAVEKKDGAFTFEGTKRQAALEALLATFLTPEVLRAPVHDVYAPGIIGNLDGGLHYARYHRDDAPLPADNLFAWCSANLLFIALYDDQPDDCGTCGPIR